MNFPAFTGPIPSIHQFAAKFGYEGSSGGLVQGQDVTARYSPNITHFGAQSHVPTMDIGGKFRATENAVSLNNIPNSVGVSLGGLTAMQTLNSGASKYQTLSTSTSASTITLNNIQQYTGAISTQYQQAGLGIQQGQVSQGPTQQGQVAQQGQLILQGQGSQQGLKEERRSEGKARDNNGYTQQIRDELGQEVMTIVHQPQGQNQNFNNQQQHTQIMVVLHDPKDIPTSLGKTIKQEVRDNRINGTAEFINPSASSSSMSMAATWQSLAAPGSAVADYLSQLPASALPLSLHHLLKYSTTDTKRVDDVTTNNLISAAVAANGLNTVIPGNGVGTVVVQSAALNSLNCLNTSTLANTTTAASPNKKKKKKKAPKEKKPRPKPGEIRLTTALDGSTLYCCPECQMAYPERGMLEQHLVGHTMERRFICDICNAALKRKDHLTRHKQSHNPERPYVCTVCLKAFKRKEQLTLHFVIHSGEKRHVCQECGKGFYRKDHLRKHTRSHIARRVKAELSQQGQGVAAPQPALAPPVPAPS